MKYDFWTLTTHFSFLFTLSLQPDVLGLLYFWGIEYSDSFKCWMVISSVCKGLKIRLCFKKKVFTSVKEQFLLRFGNLYKRKRLFKDLVNLSNCNRRCFRNVVNINNFYIFQQYIFNFKGDQKECRGRKPNYNKVHSVRVGIFCWKLVKNSVETLMYLII